MDNKELAAEVGRLPSAPGYSAEPEPVPVSAVPASIPSASRKRNWRGRFIKTLRQTPEDSREWLIWSRYHHAWHRRDATTGGACGYSNDIAYAGLFPRAKADSYNDGDRNEAFHISEKMPQINAALALHDVAVANLRTASAMSAGSGETEGLAPKDASAVGEAETPNPESDHAR